jgi:hypothetical protein
MVEVPLAACAHDPRPRPIGARRYNPFGEEESFYDSEFFLAWGNCTQQLDALQQSVNKDIKMVGSLGHLAGGSMGLLQLGHRWKRLRKCTCPSAFCLGPCPKCAQTRAAHRAMRALDALPPARHCRWSA